MTVELTNHLVEMSAIYDVEKVISNTYGNVTYFKFYFGKNMYSQEYRTPRYSYRVIKD